jgi:TolB-like protein/class 3 adenylate cyclase/Flp pilus assembly protein TadD
MSESRKLAAILAADVVGYSRLAGADEDRILARLRALRSDLIDPTIAVHHGRVVKRTGDGALVEFRSVVDAVRCAIEVQNAMVERNAGVPPDRRIEFRIGIHIGDVVEESDGDLMGDGVNIAARLEGVAAPGAICLSEDAYRQVRSRLDLLVSDLGETQLKNIAEPMRIYSLQVGISANGGAIAAQVAPTQPAVAMAEPSSASGAAPIELPEKPSIAVLPFTNMSGDPEQEYFADGMVEDVITALSRFSQLFVIARNSSFTYKGRAVDVRQAARELGVRYVLEGSVRKSGNRLRITGQLIDALSGSHLWADKFDGAIEDVFDLQDKITESVVGAIEPTIRKAEIERARRKPAENLNAYDHYLRALPLVYAFRPEENLAGLGLLIKALDFDPTFAPALANAAWCLEQRLTRGWAPFGQDDAALAVSLARRAIASGGNDATALVMSGFVLIMVGRDYDVGLDAVHRALDLNPGSGVVALFSGYSLVFAGDPEDALAQAKRAIALNPLDPGLFLYLGLIGFAHLLSGRPEQAIEFGRRSTGLYPDWDSTYWVMVAACAQLDRMDDARRALVKLLSLSPGLTVSAMQRALPFRDPASLGMLLEGFRKAGMPE